MFYNTGIGTYVWIATNRKEKRRKGKVQLIDARDCYVPMRRSLGDKRRKLGEAYNGRITDSEQQFVFLTTCSPGIGAQWAICGALDLILWGREIASRYSHRTGSA